MSSSPSTRFDGSDIDGLKEDDLPTPKVFLQVIDMIPPLSTAYPRWLLIQNIDTTLLARHSITAYPATRMLKPHNACVTLQLYAESKAMGEKAVLDACSDSLLTVAIAPHQIYGPRYVAQNV